MNVVDEHGIFLKGLLKFLGRRTKDIVVTLHTNPVDGNTTSLHPEYHREDAVAFQRIAFVVVIVEEQSLGICLTCKQESLGNELLPTKTVEFGF